MGRAPCCDKANVKKGPWSPEEDEKLKEYIEKHGTGGNWISLPQKAGLKRCGKSCRLRWLNYLRPNIKHGEFSHDEDRIICTLFAAIGSRWSIIAAQLPGRTDNDIKNYWNTKLKKKLLGSIPQCQRKPLHSYTNLTSFVQGCSPPFSPSPSPSPILSYNPNPLNTITTTTTTSFPIIASNNNTFQPQDSLMGPIFYESQAYGVSNSNLLASQRNDMIEQMGLSNGYCSFNVQDNLQTLYANIGPGNDFLSHNPSDYGLEEIKQLISSGSGSSSSSISSSSNNYCDDSSNFILFDENKSSTDTQERVMLYY